MRKKEAVEEFVKRDINNGVPISWVEAVSDKYGQYLRLPMWGTMWIVDNYIGEKLDENSRVMYDSLEELKFNLDEIEDEKEQARVKKAIEKEDWSVLEDYIDEEMTGEKCVLDKDGRPTALFVYEVGDEYVIGVNGAGWNFYDGVWDRLYDLLEYKWHDEEEK